MKGGRIACRAVSPAPSAGSASPQTAGSVNTGPGSPRLARARRVWAALLPAWVPGQPAPPTPAPCSGSRFPRGALRLETVRTQIELSEESPADATAGAPWSAGTRVSMCQDPHPALGTAGLSVRARSPLHSGQGQDSWRPVTAWLQPGSLQQETAHWGPGGHRVRARSAHVSCAWAPIWSQSPPVLDSRQWPPQETPWLCFCQRPSSWHRSLLLARASAWGSCPYDRCPRGFVPLSCNKHEFTAQWPLDNQLSTWAPYKSLPAGGTPTFSSLPDYCGVGTGMCWPALSGPSWPASGPGRA